MFSAFKKSIVILGISAAAGLAQAAEFEDGFMAAQASDYTKAAAKLEPLALKNDARAQFLLGTMYHNGAAGQMDEATAVKLYHKAAEGGVPEAQEYLAAAYQEGWFGLKKDEKQAKYWKDQLAK
ncbi:MAG: hypothetical protein OEW58_07150 [Gammaproteobacteria bacterium]|nr:hypothetical protein [Gammaproteobacteria bacterium]